MIDACAPATGTKTLLHIPQISHTVGPLFLFYSYECCERGGLGGPHLAPLMGEKVRIISDVVTLSLRCGRTHEMPGHNGLAVLSLDMGGDVCISIADVFWGIGIRWMYSLL